MAKVIGIDLGMTNSRVAVMQKGQLVVIANAEGFRSTPSVVAYQKNGECLVGELAKQQGAIDPENTFYDVKRFIGRRYEEVTDEAAKVPYQVFPDSNGNVKFNCPNLGKEFSPEEITAQILRKLAEDASRYLGEEVTQIVITVPTYFTDAQRQATKDAGKIAGLEVLRIIHEPTAVCLAHQLHRKSNETILVFDLGGATLDVTILEIGEGVFEVLATSSDRHLGGNDFDQKIINWLIGEFQRQEAIDLRGDKQALQWVAQAAEKAKIELDSATQTAIEFINATQDSSKYRETILTRTEFEAICSDLLNRCLICIEQALKDAKLFTAVIDEVVLVGDSTSIPVVRELVRQVTGKEPRQSIDPSEAVVSGAAIQGEVLCEPLTLGMILLLDVTSLSLGIETLGGIMTEIMPRNTTIPTRKSAIFSTAVDGQTSVEIHVLQGERFLAKDNMSLGRLRLDGIVPAYKGVPKIEVTFNIDANHILKVSARDLATGKEQSIRITGFNNLPYSQFERMRMDAERHAEEDRKLREPIEAREKAESLVDDAHRQLMQLSDKMSAADKGLVEDLVQHLQEVKEKLNSDRTNSLINRSSSNLVPVVTPVFALAQAITTSDSEDLIDADFDCVD